MQAIEYPTKRNAGIEIIAEQHVRAMLSYYILRGLMDENKMVETERTAIRESAIEIRCSGFRLEAQVEPLGIQLDMSSDERLRREATRIINLSRTSETEAKQGTDRVVAEVVSHILETEPEEEALAA